MHDSSANFNRCEAAGFHDFTLLSTGTWFVGLSDHALPPGPNGLQDITRQISAGGRMLSGNRCMAGREYAFLAGGYDGEITEATVERLIAQRTLAIPSFVDKDGVVQHSRNRGRIVGPAPRDPAEAGALALLYVVVMADLCLAQLASSGMVIVDGNATAQPLFGALLARLRQPQSVWLAHATDGTAAGAAMLAGPAAWRPSPPLQAAVAATSTAIRHYQQQWRALVAQLERRQHNVA